MRYHYQEGIILPFVNKYYKQLIIVVAAIFMATFAAMSLITSAAPPNWTVNSGSTINFSCGGGNYEHVFDTVVQGSGGNFTGTGHYVPDGSYTWDATGNVSGDVLEFSIEYTGTAAGSIYNLTNGDVGVDGSVSGDVDSNCESFAMPAGSLSSFGETEIDVYGNTGVQNEKGAWMFNRDVTTATEFEFNTNESVLGVGSLNVLPIGNDSAFGDDDKFIAEYFAREAISNFESFSYDFKIAGDGVDADANKFYVNFYTTLTDGTNFYNCRFDYVPSVGSTADFTTFTVDKNTVASTSGGANCPVGTKTLSNMAAGSYIRAISINVGDTSISDQDLAGYLDNVSFVTSIQSLVFDFEPYPAVTSKEACKNGGWMFGLSYTNQNAFKNQGDCVSYFATKGRNLPNGN